MSYAIKSKFVLGGLIGAGVIGSLAYLVSQPESQMLGRTLVDGQDPSEIALTFDDGPNDRSTLPLLEVLDRHNARATFFMIGRFVRERPELARAVHRAGHLIGNHTVTHPFLATKPYSVIEAELRGCNQVLEDVLGEPVRYFRAPYGARRPGVLRCAHELGLVPVQWNVTGRDWEPIGCTDIVQRVEEGIASVQSLGRGSNVLLHDGFHDEMGYDRSATVRATDILLTTGKQQGMQFVTVDTWADTV